MADARVGARIFIGGPMQNLTSKDLTEYFSSFGETLDVYIPRDPASGGNKDFAFVTYKDEVIAQRVMDQTPHQVKDVSLDIKPATAKSDKTPGKGAPTPAVGSMGGTAYRGGVTSPGMTGGWTGGSMNFYGGAGWGMGGYGCGAKGGGYGPAYGGGGYAAATAWNPAYGGGCGGCGCSPYGWGAPASGPPMGGAGAYGCGVGGGACRQHGYSPY
eukprot:TRINITY_DN67426_c0_g1_i1.p1 TRINITY_DN67426_c0_g1~~TRINITY_DN67426_c0_g1_i1.p1  ORF type:complete len:237 (-),score=30.18 TRINITY_DN67426_c0_g1_i1:37-678(-)